MFTRRGVLASTAAVIIGWPKRASAAGHPVMERLLRDRMGQVCTPAQTAALLGTLKRLSQAALPTQGRFILVNTAACTLDAYDSGVPVLTMLTACGKRRAPTPSLSVSAGVITLNPTWTPPASILREADWSHAVSDPVFMRKWGFSHIGGRVVQAPGPHNLLGKLKLSLEGGGTIYLHDTNEPEGFALTSRHLTHGCVRLQHPAALGAWLLGLDPQFMVSRIDSGSRVTMPPIAPTAVTLAYFTAWPDAQGRIAFHPDPYGLDGEHSHRKVEGIEVMEGTSW